MKQIESTPEVQIYGYFETNIFRDISIHCYFDGLKMLLENNVLGALRGLACSVCDTTSQKAF